jgi:hypothetical protein
VCLANTTTVYIRPKRSKEFCWKTITTLDRWDT